MIFTNSASATAGRGCDIRETALQHRKLTWIPSSVEEGTDGEGREGKKEKREGKKEKDTETESQTYIQTDRHRAGATDSGLGGAACSEKGPLAEGALF